MTIVLSDAFPESYFFIPEHIVLFKGNKLTCSQGIDPKSFIDMIGQYEDETKEFSTPVLHPATPKLEYLETVQKIKDHILEGDIYEMTAKVDNKESVKIDEYTYKYGTKMGKLIRMVLEIMKETKNRIIIFSQWDSLLKLISKHSISLL